MGYTAITRAKGTLGFLLHYHFDQSERLTGPRWSPLPEEGRPMATEPVTSTSEPADIVDPVVPEAVLAAVSAVRTQDPPTPAWAEHEALLSGFCQQLQKRLEGEMLSNGHKLMQAIDAMGQSMQRWIEGHLQVNEHSQYQVSDALLKLQEHGVQLRHAPYVATVQALSQAGYPVSITLTKQETKDLIEALPLLLTWLQEEGYKPVEHVAF
jgi:hypothetical protein